MWSHLIILHSPLLYQDLSFLQCSKDFTVQKLITRKGAEAVSKLTINVVRVEAPVNTSPLWVVDIGIYIRTTTIKMIELVL